MENELIMSISYLKNSIDELKQLIDDLIRTINANNYYGKHLKEEISELRKTLEKN